MGVGFSLLEIGESKYIVNIKNKAGSLIISNVADMCGGGSVSCHP